MHSHSTPPLFARALVALGVLLLIAGLLELAALKTSNTSNTPNLFRAFPVQIQQSARSHQPWCAAQMAAAVIGTAGNVPANDFPVTPFPASFWFVKTVKTGSSTLTSVFHSICSHYGIQWLKTDLSRLVVGVGKPKADKLSDVFKAVSNVTDSDFLAITNHMVYNQQVADVFQPTMLFTTVRHPLSRVHSHYIQDACVATAKELGWSHILPHRQQQNTGPNFCDTAPDFLEQVLQRDTLDKRWEFARSKLAQNYVYDYIRGDANSVDDAAKQYDFIFTSERMNEGLVLFMLQYGLTFEDIVYLPLKKRVGKYKTAADMPKELNDYILDNNQLDLQLWELANRQLDQQKATLQQQCGQPTVENALTAFEQLLAEVEFECTSYEQWYSNHGFDKPYTYTGLPEIAYDSGNGYRCVRHVARRFMLAGQKASAGAITPAKISTSTTVADEAVPVSPGVNTHHSTGEETAVPSPQGVVYLKRRLLNQH